MTSGKGQGLFAIVLLVSFGIFAYSMIDDNFNLSLASIFSDVFTQDAKASNGSRYVLLRGSYDTHPDVFVTFKDNDTGVTITGVSITEDGEFRKDNDEDFPLGLTGEISFDKQIDNKNITEIDSEVFKHSKFTGDFYAPNVTTIGDGAFNEALFEDNFIALNVTTIGSYAFSNSKFKHTFNAPKLTTIGREVFYTSTFIGNFIAPELKTIGGRAFRNSKFSGDFDAPKVTTIEYSSFWGSEFSGEFNVPKVTTIGGSVFEKSIFKAAYAPELTNLGIANGNLNEWFNQKTPSVSS